MRGIAEYIGHFIPGLVSRMNAIQKHRGPDGLGNPLSKVFTPLESPAALSGDEDIIPFGTNTGFNAPCEPPLWKVKDFLTGFTRGEAKRMFSRFQFVETKVYWLVKKNIPFIGKYIPRPLDYTLGRLMGWALYIIAVK